MAGIDRREFLRLAAASALAAPARAVGGEARPSAGSVHRATRNTWRGAAGLGSLFAKRPLPYKAYAGAPRLELPRGNAISGLPLADAARDDAPAPAFAGEPITLGVLATLLALTNGVTGIVVGSDPPERRRAAPSAGALYAGELYVVADQVDGLTPGVFYYAVAEHALVQVRSGPRLGEVADALEAPDAARGAACAVLLSNVFARYAWRYGTRGYRYALVDSGHIGENLRLVARAARLAHARLPRFADDTLAGLLGIDGREEAVCALHLVGHAGGARRGAPDPGRTLVERGEADASLGEVERYHAATRLVWGEASGPPPVLPHALAAPATLTLAAASLPSLPVARAIHARRSARGFREEPIEPEALAFALALARSPGLGLRLVVHRVRGVEPGVYEAAAGDGALAVVRPGAFERPLVRACLFQEKAGSAAVAFAWVADLGRAGAAGERSYRDRLVEAGAAAERVYLAAESLGLAARNLAAFFDDSLNALLALDGRQVVVHLTLLGPEMAAPPLPSPA